MKLEYQGFSREDNRSTRRGGQRDWLKLDLMSLDFILLSTGRPPVQFSHSVMSDSL